MIYLFSGDDTKNKIKKLEDFLNKNKLPIFYINKNNFSKDEIEGFFTDSNLFNNKNLILFSDVLENEEINLFLLNNLPSLDKSSNVFVFNENKLLKIIIDKFQKTNAEINNFELKKEQKELFNNFLLADAFFNKDKVKLWIYYRQATDRGVIAEELVGVLFWKVKDMILNKRFFKFKEEELKEIAFKLSHILPKAREEKKDAETIFEKFLLEVC